MDLSLEFALGYSKSMDAGLKEKINTTQMPLKCTKQGFLWVTVPKRAYFPSVTPVITENGTFAEFTRESIMSIKNNLNKRINLLFNNFSNTHTQWGI